MRTDDDVGYLLDTMIFNRIIDGKLSLHEIRGKRVFATHIQRDELANTADAERRDRLLAAFASVGPEPVPTSSAVWDISRFGEACWPAEDGTYESLLNRITQLDKGGSDERRLKNRHCDALTADTAIKRAMVLVTDDQDLAAAAREAGGSVLSLAEFRALRPST